MSHGMNNARMETFWASWKILVPEMIITKLQKSEIAVTAEHFCDV